MSVPVDLMPVVCREALGRRAWVRGWVTSYVAVAVLLLAGWWGAGLGWSAKEAERSELRTRVSQMYERNDEIQRLIKEISELEASITRHNRLASPVRVSEVLDVLGATVPRGVSLNSLAFSPREQKALATAPKQVANAPKLPALVESKMFLVIEAEGVAASDREISAFVAGLEGHALFSRVGLDYTRSLEKMAPGARGFRMTCEIDLSRSYEFVAASPAAGGEGAGE